MKVESLESIAYPPRGHTKMEKLNPPLQGFCNPDKLLNYCLENRIESVDFGENGIRITLCSTDESVV